MSDASPEEACSEETNFGVTGTDEETASYDPIIIYHRACELGWGFNKRQVHVSNSEEIRLELRQSSSWFD
jgi:hypothetical protein